ncbi:hypothetical protein IKF03_00605 [Candidatus Saccharibacteria bacterium]|nr:hypothetical protein [Candidatus Saccharibacteria bacterium]
MARLLRKLYIRLIHSLIVLNVELCLKHYLNGFRVWEFYHNEAISRLGEYLKHGLCYESTALLMLVWKDFRKTRIAFLDCYSGYEKRRVDHAWFEFKRYGIWWVIDSTWCKAIPLPRAFYATMVRARYVRIIDHEEFWRPKFVADFYEHLKTPENSYLFFELVLFRRMVEHGVSMYHEHRDVKNLLADGENPTWSMMGIYGNEHPISQQMLREYIARPKRKRPKERTIRKTIRLQNTVERAIVTAQEHYDKTGEKVFIHLKSISSYKLELETS